MSIGTNVGTTSWRDLHASGVPRVGAVSLITAAAVRAVMDSDSELLKKWLDVNQLISVWALCSQLDRYDVPVPGPLLVDVQKCQLGPMSE